ncbi:Pex19 protein family-domain-containing protein [Entophlyctis helioformis]|nr:Pex19 protein family-domain-containing protein [Entophlyctis helioformis]
MVDALCCGLITAARHLDVLDDFAAPVVPAVTSKTVESSATVVDAHAEADSETSIKALAAAMLGATAGGANASDPDALGEDFVRQLAEDMERLLLAQAAEDGNASSTPAVHAQASHQETIMAATPIKQPQDFQSHIAQTMDKLKRSSEKADAQVAEDMKNLGGLEGMDEALLSDLLKDLEKMMDSDEYGGMFNGLMDELMKKDFLYEPMKELASKYPEWLNTNRGQLAPAELKRYEDQLDAIKTMIAFFDSLPGEDLSEEDSKRVMDMMNHIQTFGNPPDDLLKDMTPGMESGTDGMPKLPDEGCKQM